MFESALYTLCLLITYTAVDSSCLLRPCLFFSEFLQVSVFPYPLPFQLFKIFFFTYKMNKPAVNPKCPSFSFHFLFLPLPFPSTSFSNFKPQHVSFHLLFFYKTSQAELAALCSSKPSFVEAYHLSYSDHSLFSLFAF